jgi:hypothetical protein
MGDLQQRLSDLFNIYGSDKTSKHSYERAYSYFLKNININSLLEIGISNNSLPGFDSSLLAWQRVYPYADIYGIDIDEGKVNSARSVGVKAFCVDQSSLVQLRRFVEENKNVKFDFILDDGSHVFNDAKLTFECLLDSLSENGVYCIEDIAKVDHPGNRSQQTLDEWVDYLDNAVLQKSYTYEVIDTRPDVINDDSIVIGVERKI